MAVSKLIMSLKDFQLNSGEGFTNLRKGEVKSVMFRDDRAFQNMVDLGCIRQAQPSEIQQPTYIPQLRPIPVETHFPPHVTVEHSESPKPPVPSEEKEFVPFRPVIPEPKTPVIPPADAVVEGAQQVANATFLNAMSKADMFDWAAKRGVEVNPAKQNKKKMIHSILKQLEECKP